MQIATAAANAAPQTVSARPAISSSRSTSQPKPAERAGPVEAVETPANGSSSSGGAGSIIAKSSGLAVDVPEKAEVHGSSSEASAFEAALAEQAERAKASSDSNLSLIMSEQNGGAQVVTAVAGLSLEAGPKLRKLATDVLAEFGMTLAHFSLNGSAIDGYRAASIGGQNDRSRG